jgi:hypothetical protein
MSFHDYKYQIQQRAEELAEKVCGNNYDLLSAADREKMYELAFDAWRDDAYDRADRLRDERKDNG